MSEDFAAKFVDEVDQVSFSGARAKAQGQEVTYISERCVICLRGGRLVVTEVAPGLDLQKDILDQAATQLLVADDVKEMSEALFQPDLIGLQLAGG